MRTIEERLIRSRRIFDHSALTLWACGLACIVAIAVLPAIV